MGDMADYCLDSRWDDPDELEDCPRVFSRSHVNTSPIPYIRIVKETEKAWLVELTDNTNQWYPKKIVKIHIDKKEMIVPDWLLAKIRNDNRNKCNI